MQHFPSVFQTLAKKMRLLPESWTLTSMYNDFLTRLGQEFNDTFNDFEKIEPCVMFTLNPFMKVDVRDISEQISVQFDLDCVHLEMEIISLQNDIQFEIKAICHKFLESHGY